MKLDTSKLSAEYQAALHAFLAVVSQMQAPCLRGKRLSVSFPELDDGNVVVEVRKTPRKSPGKWTAKP